MSLYSEIRQRIRLSGGDPKKSLGQNFLVDERILDRIATVATEGSMLDTPGGTTTALEIGPGPGTLTERLARVGPVHAIEKDRRWFEFLRGHFAGDSSVTLVQGDALEQSWSDVGEGSVLVGNLPYYISAPLLIRALKHRRHFRQATFMLQDEVASRLVAHAGTKVYGRLSVMTQLCGEVRKILRVPPGAFWPRPKVGSAVVRILFRDRIDDPTFSRLEEVVQRAFAQRRKRLSNALTAGLDPKEAEKVLRQEERGFDLGARAEAWPPETYLRWVESLKIWDES
ncbi:MAG: 16S rRNA (adenine(1518)-N(6)/adenine(1519)-N(6))-dimethyltransferase RsmA [Myxococcota bacterium]